MPVPYLAPMTLDQFNALPNDHRLAAIYATGTYLATRWEDMNAAVMLYHLPGRVFAELCYDTVANAITDVRSFADGAQLEDYAHYLAMPEGLDELEDL